MFDSTQTLSPDFRPTLTDRIKTGFLFENGHGRHHRRRFFPGGGFCVSRPLGHC